MTSTLAAPSKPSKAGPVVAALASGLGFTAFVVGLAPFLFGLDDASGATTVVDLIPHYGAGSLAALAAAVFFVASIVAHPFWVRHALVLARAAASPGALRLRLGMGSEHPRVRSVLSFIFTPYWFFLFIIGRKSVLLLAGVVLSLLFAQLVNRVFASFLVVGSDGLALENGRKRRFLAFADIDVMQPDPEHGDGFFVFLKTGEKIAVRTNIVSQKRDLKKTHPDFARVWNPCVRKLAEWREHQVQSGGTSLARGGATAKEWIAKLDELRSEGYRQGSIPEETLWKVAEDPLARPEERAAALVALRKVASFRKDAERRVRVDASAEPRLRVVLDAVALENEDAIAAALDDLHQSAAK